MHSRGGRQSRHAADVRSAQGIHRTPFLRFRRGDLRADRRGRPHLLHPRRGEVREPRRAQGPNRARLRGGPPPPCRRDAARLSPPAMSEKPDYRSTVFLPKTDFPMKAGLSQKEPAILARWAEDGLYEQIRGARKGRERFILHDGPPYANGDIHIGHAMMKTIKDFILRSQSLLGKDAPFIPGWDCHGLPIEWKIEEQDRKKKLDKDQVPPREFRAECRAYAEHWIQVQREQFIRLGITGDWDDPYRTMDFSSEAKICEEFLKLAEAGRIYRGAKPVMWSPVGKTAPAEAEIEYEDIVSTQIGVGFEIVESPIPQLVGAYAVAWTTTPWTIPVNQGIAYNPEVEYILLTYSSDNARPSPVAGTKFLVARELMVPFLDRLQVLFEDESQNIIWDRSKGEFK